ncbi:uncharacterized protein V1518DRAFT_414297 [Limtongia smithiae]|uniref:uncharacterized protein n=1 Tax=Limtongia smithiae TaxID=1125753 RepID=UPI0034CEA447
MESVEDDVATSTAAESSAMNLPTVSHSNPRRPRSFPYSELLPFAVEPDASRQEHLNEILANLELAMRSQPVSFSTLCHWNYELCLWLSLKFDMPRHTRTQLVKIFYELALARGLSKTVFRVFADTFCTLCAKEYLLNRDDLVLDWRILYSRMETILFPAQYAGVNRARELRLNDLSKIALYAQRFFAPEAVYDIFHELLPLFNVQRATAHSVVRIIDLLLPVSTTPITDPSLHPQMYLPTIFHVWSLYTRSYTFDLSMLDLVSRLCRVGLRDPNILFTSTGILTKEQTAYMLTSALRLLDIPVGRSGSPYTASFEPYAKEAGESRRRKISRTMSLWIVFSLSNKCLDDPNSILNGFAGLIQSVETFFHPSNYGYWSKYLFRMLEAVATTFTMRWNREQSGELPTPEDRRLSPAVKRQFVLAIKDAVMTGIHTKTSHTASNAQFSLQALTYLEPDIMLPIILSQAYGSLQGVVETARTTVAMTALSYSAERIVKHKRYRLHVTAVLGMLVPGIDPNDLHKTLKSLEVIQSFAAYMPFADLSENVGSGPAMEYFTACLEAVEAGEDLDSVQLSDEDELLVLKSSTATFEEFTTSLMSRIYTLLENLPKQNTYSDSPERNVLNVMPKVFNVVFAAVSDDIFGKVLDQFATFALDNVIYQARLGALHIAGALLRAQPERTLSRLFPLLVSRIREEIDENHAGRSTNLGDVAPSDMNLLWYMTILRGIIWPAGAALLKYKDELFDLMIYLREKTHGATADQSGALIFGIIINFTTIYHCDFHLVNRSELQANGGYSFADWGKQTAPKDLEIEWHSPTSDEVTFAVSLFEDNIEWCISQLTSLMAEKQPKAQKTWSEELTRLLSYFTRVLSSMAALYDMKQLSASQGEDSEMDVSAPDEIDDIELADAEEEKAVDDNLMNDIDDAFEADEDDDDRDVFVVYSMSFRYPRGYYFENNTDSPLCVKVHELHNKIGHMLHSIHTDLMKNHEDEVQPMGMLLESMRSWFLDVGFANTTHRFPYFRDGNKFKMVGLHKILPRYALTLRALLYCKSRMLMAIGRRKMCALDKDLLQDLVQSSTARYAVNRIFAQRTLEAAMKTLDGSGPHVGELLISELNNAVAAKNAPKIKGALYTANICRLNHRMTNDLRFRNSYALTLLGAAKLDDNSLHDLSRKAIIAFSHSTLTEGGSMYYSDSVVQIWRTILPYDKDFAATIETRSKRNAQRMKRAETNSEELEAELLKIYKEEPHWRISMIASTMMISQIGYYRTRISAELGQIAIKGMVDPHPYLRMGFLQGVNLIVNVVEARAFTKYDEKNLLFGNYAFDDLVKIPVNRSDPEFITTYHQQLTDPEAPYYSGKRYQPGWLVWGKEFEVQKHPYKRFPAALNEQDSKLIEMIGVLIDARWFSQYAKILLQEPRSEKDTFRQVYAIISALISGLVYDGVTTLKWDEYLRLIRRVYDDAPMDKNHQRATAELLAGLVGNIHSTEYSEKVIAFAMGIYDDVFYEKLTPETLDSWTNNVSFLGAYVDPRTIWPLAQKLGSARIDDTSNAAFKESAKFSLLKCFIWKADWTFTQTDKILADFMDHLDQSYKYVREEIGATIARIMQTRLRESFSDVDGFLQANRNAGSLGVRAFPPTVELDVMMDNVFDKLAHWRERRIVYHDPNSYTNGSKTVMLWFDSILDSPAAILLLPYFGRVILPELLNFMDVKEHEELVSLSVRLFRVFGNIPWPPCLLDDLVNAIVEIVSTSEMWHQRLRVLPLIQAIFFRQLFQLSTKNRKAMFECVADRLSDPQLEVRETAAETLSGMIRCSPKVYRDATVKRLDRQFTKLLRQNPLPVTSSQSIAENSNAITIARHAAVLGLSSLVRAFPYESPPPVWMPGVLTTLVNRAASDSGMVGRSVKTALGEFKKTRQDTWHVDVRVFNAEQLEDLEGVLWRTYFA